MSEVRFRQISASYKEDLSAGAAPASGEVRADAGYLLSKYAPFGACQTNERTMGRIKDSVKVF